MNAGASTQSSTRNRKLKNQYSLYSGPENVLSIQRVVKEIEQDHNRKKHVIKIDYKDRTVFLISPMLYARMVQAQEEVVKFFNFDSAFFDVDEDIFVLVPWEQDCEHYKKYHLNGWRISVMTGPNVRNIEHLLATLAIELIYTKVRVSIG